MTRCRTKAWGQISNLSPSPLVVIGVVLVLAGCPNPADVNCGEVPGRGRGVADLTWEAVDDPRVEGYKVHRGTVPGEYNAVVDVGKRTSCHAANLRSGTTYYFAISTYGDEGESPPSDAVSKAIP